MKSHLNAHLAIMENKNRVSFQSDVLSLGETHTYSLLVLISIAGIGKSEKVQQLTIYVASKVTVFGIKT